MSVNGRVNGVTFDVLPGVRVEGGLKLMVGNSCEKAGGVVRETSKKQELSPGKKRPTTVLVEMFRAGTSQVMDAVLEKAVPVFAITVSTPLFVPVYVKTAAPVESVIALPDALLAPATLNCTVAPLTGVPVAPTTVAVIVWLDPVTSGPAIAGANVRVFGELTAVAAVDERG